MAFVAQNLPEEEQNKFGNTAPTTPLPPQQGGSAGAGASQPGAAPGVGTPTQFGSNAAKLSDYLAANKEQVGQMGKGVTDSLSQGYNQAQGAVNQGVQQFGQQVNQGYVPYDASTVNQAASNPSDFVKNPENVSKFQSIYNDQYQGPQNFEGSSFYSNANDQVNKAVQNAGLVGSQAGLGTYLNNMGAQDSTQGMRTLDTALLQGNKDVNQSIRDAAAPYQNLQGYLSDQTQRANSGVQTAQQSADQARQMAQNQFTGPNGAIPSFQNDLNSRVGQARTAASDKTTKEMADINAGKATPQEIADFKADPNAFAKFQQQGNTLRQDYGTGFDATNYFTPVSPQSAITPETLGTSDDFSKAAALAQLTGTDLSSFLNPANAGMAGTAPNVLSNFDLGKAGTDVANDLSFSDQRSLQQNQNPGANADPRLVDIFGRNKNMLNNAQMAWWMQQVGLPGPGTVNTGSGTITTPGSTPIGFGGTGGTV